MKPNGSNFKIRLQLRSQKCRTPTSKAEGIVARKSINQKNKQLEEAVAWCKERNVRGCAALKTGLFPLIKDRETIKHRLDGKVVTGQEK